MSHHHNHSHSHGHCQEENVEVETIQVLHAEESPATPLGQFFNAVRYGLKAPVISILSTNPELINELDSHGHSAVHWAAKRGDLELLQILLENGANLSLPTNTDAQMLPIHWAASDGKISSIRFLLDNRPQDLNAQDGNGCTPVAVAAQHNQPTCIAFLVKNGADMTVRDCNGDTALHWAAYKGYGEAVGLLTYCMPRELDLVDEFGQTALHLAAIRGHEDVVEYLVADCHADAARKDRNGCTALDLAAKKQQFKVEWVLRRLAARSVCCGLLRGLTTKKLSESKVFLSLCCGSNEKELSAWPWRIVFLSNLFASLTSISFSMDSHLSDLQGLHQFNTTVQLLWWGCFLMCLFKSPSFVRDDITSTSSATAPLPPTSSANETAHLFTYEAALTAIGLSRTDDGQAPAVCHSCHVCKPLRSKHCKVQRRCVNKFDHFCPFVGNTVGRDNYKYFFSLLVVHVFCAVGWEVAAFHLWYRTRISWSLFLYMIYAVMWLGMIVMLLQYHMQLIAKNLTTNEQINMAKYAYMRNAYNIVDNPFDRGSVLANLLNGLFPSSKVYFTREDVIVDRVRANTSRSKQPVSALLAITGSSNSSNNNNNGNNSGGNSPSIDKNHDDDKLGLLERGLGRR